jgi:DNA polymerase III subunit epsilon
MYLFFDTETTGLPVSWKALISDVDNWPRVVQLAWAVFDNRGRKTGARSYVIRPDGFTIPKDAERIHGISTLRAKRTGIPISEALDDLMEVLGRSRVVVAHNFSFDGNVVGAEFYRLGIRNQFRRKVQVCTKESGTDFCALPGRYGFKWPTLTELHLKLFGKKVRETHNAASDVATCAKCFFELKRLGVVRITKRLRVQTA